MEIANQWAMLAEGVGGVRRATQDDAGTLTQLLRDAPYSHLHADWHYPAEWLDSEGFTLIEAESTAVPPADSMVQRLYGSPSPILACLAIAADPLPAAWVRVAALARPSQAEAHLAAQLAAIAPRLRETGVAQIGWLVVGNWPSEWFINLGFDEVNAVASYVLHSRGRAAAAEAPPGLVIRPVETADLPTLEQIEADAFEPLWRHSAAALGLAMRQTLSFDVAELDGRVAGFQFSTATRRGAHLSRMTVDPAVQRQGIGGALLAHVLTDFEQRGLATVTLNTQIDNKASQRLYERFGFRANGERFLVWALTL